MITLDEFAQKFLTMPPEHQQIVALVGQGYTNQDIARVLNYSVGTVKTTINRICDSLFGATITGTKRRSELRNHYNDFRLWLAKRNFSVGDTFPGIVQNCLAVYGSLADPDSLRRTLVDHRGPVDYIPAFLDNHTIHWGLPSYRPLVDSDGNSVRDLYLEWLVVTQDTGSSEPVRVALINVSDADLERLKARERSYELATVTDDIRLASGNPLPGGIKEVLTFRKPDAGHPAVPAGFRVAARKGYADLVTRAFAYIHGFGFALPQPSAIADVHDADSFSLEKWKSESDEGIIERDQALRNKLIDERCIRLENSRLPVPIPYALRPLVIQRGVFEEAMAVSETAVSLCGKALTLLLSDRQLQEAAGYNDNDIRLASPSLANNFIGRGGGRNRPNLPEICRVDLILTNQGRPARAGTQL